MSEDDEDERVDTSCNCDLDHACSYPPCVAEREAEAAHYRAIFQGTQRALTREEWDMAYADNPAKRMAYPEEGTR